MKRRLRLIGPCILLTSIVGCATTDNIRIETARSIGDSVTPSQIVLSDIHRSITQVTWKASAPTGDYDCSTDVMLYLVYCSTGDIAGMSVQGNASTGSSAR